MTLYSNTASSQKFPDCKILLVHSASQIIIKLLLEGANDVPQIFEENLKFCFTQDKIELISKLRTELMKISNSELRKILYKRN